MADRFEVSCSGCPYTESVTDGDQPGEMQLRTYAAWLASNHQAGCAGRAEVGTVPDIEADTTKYDTGGVLNGD